MTLTADILTTIQLFFAVVIGLYFWNLLRAQHGNKTAVEKDSRRETERLRRLREISLTEPLSERTRPTSFADIVGQEDGIKALRAALCGPNPQHVLIYGPPGVGKTAAARLILEEARQNPLSPFGENSRFVEIDATVARFDERGIADPLIGSVHDPIYQGAGPMGLAGIPQPKPGAVTKAHGGLLFIDEIGELHPTQMNKLLKVLEDRKVFLESAYYSAEDPNVPTHIRDIFENGLPADFRLVGATTRRPEDLPPALRSRCLEIFFRPLERPEVAEVARRSAAKIPVSLEERALEILTGYAQNGREAVNIIAITAGLAQVEGRADLQARDVQWVIEMGQYSPRPEQTVRDRPAVGLAHGLAVFGPRQGTVLGVEAVARPVPPGTGRLRVTGAVEEEEIGTPGHALRRKSAAQAAVENVLTVLGREFGLETRDFDLHVNFPGGIPVDGPSAGVTIATALYSALTGRPVDPHVAMTGEISLSGEILPVGGVGAKVQAARAAGIIEVLIPRANWQEVYAEIPDCRVRAVDRLEEVIGRALLREKVRREPPMSLPSWGLGRPLPLP